MRILAGADFHGFKPAFEALAQKAKKSKADFVILCGDITNFGTEQQAKDLLSPLSRLNAPVLFVPGNCDPPLLININIGGIRCIHGSGLIQNDFAFIGVGGSPKTPFNTPFEISEEEIAETLRNCLKDLGGGINGRRIILVSHAPPKNTRLDRTSLGGHVGSTSVRRFIEEHKPILVLCGHIHEAKGADSLNNAFMVNPGPSKQGNCAIIDIMGSKVSIKFHALKLVLV